jgi:hypothetical protein
MLLRLLWRLGARYRCTGSSRTTTTRSVRAGGSIWLRVSIPSTTIAFLCTIYAFLLKSCIRFLWLSIRSTLTSLFIISVVSFIYVSFNLTFILFLVSIPFLGFSFGFLCVTVSGYLVPAISRVWYNFSSKNIIHSIVGIIVVLLQYSLYRAILKICAHQFFHLLNLLVYL